jgi:DNA-binding SARP family transcriptional activator/TolB-like protein
MLRLTTLGATDLRDRLGKPVREILAQPKRLALLVYLAVEGRRGPVPRDRLLAMFWPESDIEHARKSLSQSLHHLRQALGPGAVESQGTHTIGVNAERVWCDAVVLLDALGSGDASLALDLYRGDFCPALFVAGAPDVEEWLEGQRRHLRARVTAAARGHALQLAERGDAGGAARAARQALALRPEKETEVRDLLALLERAGDGAGALFAYQEYAKRLADELETEPEPATRQLVEEMRRRRAAPTPPLPPASPAGSAAADAATASMPTAGARPRHIAVLVTLALLVLGGGTLLVRARSGRTALPPAQAIAVLPFEIRGGPSLAYLREGMVDLLSAKLAGASRIRAVDPRAVLAGDSALDAARLARQLDADWYITGDVVEVAGRLQLSGALFATGSAAPAATASVTGDTTALFQLVDDLAGRMLAGVVPGRDTALTRLAGVTTHSLPALKAFLRGEQALRAGRDAQAGAAFHEAAQLDTTFALAQYRLALTANWVIVPGVLPVEWARTAARHSRRLTPMVRDLLTAYQAYKDVRWADAERMYRALTAAYPDHVEAWLMLGETYFHYNWLHGEPATEAWEPLQRVLTLDPGNVHALIHLARLAALEGRTAVLDTLVAEYVRRYGTADRSLELRALRAYVGDDRAERAALARALGDADEIVAYSVLEAAFVYAQNAAVLELAPRFDPRRRATESFAAMSDQGRRLLASVGPATGRWEHPATSWLEPADTRDWALATRVLMAAEKGFPVPRARVAALRDSLRARRPFPLLKSLTYSDPPVISGADWQRYLDGLLSVRLGDQRAAAQAASALEVAGTEGSREERAMLAHALRAEIAHAAGDDRRALAELDQFDLGPPNWIALPLHWGTRVRLLRAEVLLALGRDGEAADLYASIISTFDAPYVALAHLRRARVHARHVEPEQARFHYGRFLSLWMDADADFQPLVAQARQELEALGPAPR